jgi:hypothetical protein
MQTPAPTHEPHRLSLAQLHFLAQAAGACLPAELCALVDAAVRYDGAGTDPRLADLVDRAVVHRDGAGNLTVAEPVAASLRLLAGAEVSVDVRGRLAERTLLGCFARRGGEVVSVTLTEDGDVELRQRPAAALGEELGRLVPAQPAGTGRHGILRAQVRHGSGEGARRGQVTWVADDVGWRALLPAQTSDGQPDVQMVSRVPADLGTDLAPLLAAAPA